MSVSRKDKLYSVDPRTEREVFRQARAHVHALHAAGIEGGEHWANAVRWPTDIPADLRGKLSSLALSCLALEELELAVLLERIVGRTADAEPDNTTVRLIGAKRRAIEIRACDPYLPLMPASVVLLKTASKEIEELDLASSQGLLVSVETAPGEPTVQVPVAAGSTDVTIDLTSLSRLNLPFASSYVPPTICSIGGDLLARNSLPGCSVEFGPLAVQKTAVTIEQYEALGGDPARCCYLDRELFSEQLLPDTDVLNVRYHGHGAFPAVGLDLSDVEQFVRQLPASSNGGWDLLDDREWEALFRGPEQYVYPWGNHWIDGAANVLGTDTPALEPVGVRSLDVSRWGLRDGGGNTEEWTKPRDELVAKGGSWYNDKQIGRCASRVVRAPEYRHPKLGFRLAVRL
jgi:formylglycine-generating enzyme required for sulfatase activity